MELDQAIARTERVAESTHRKAGPVLRELSELYAAAGRYDQAISTAQAALELASAAQAEERVRQIRRMLRSYEAAKP